MVSMSKATIERRVGSTVMELTVSSSDSCRGVVSGMSCVKVRLNVFDFQFVFSQSV